MLPLTTVTLMLPAPIILGVSHVHVTMDTLGMESLAKVQLNYYLHVLSESVVALSM